MNAANATAARVDPAVVVAIDGPAASGKSTVSREVARALNWTYVDSGALYRGIAWKALRAGVKPRDAEAVKALLARSRWEFPRRGLAVAFTVDGEDPGEAIRSPDVAESVSDIAALPVVRAFVGEQLRAMRRYAPLVMEGRDIGTVVFPDAEFKFYLDADPEERARRRARDLEAQAGAADVAAVRASLERRDRKDSTRREAPLRAAPDARIMDTTGMSVGEVVARIVAVVRAGVGAA